MRFQQEQRNHLILAKEKKKRLSLEKKQAYAQIAQWQAELQAIPLFEKGLACLQEEKYQESVSWFNQAAKTDPDNLNIYYFRSQSHKKLGNQKKSLEDISNYVDQTPSSIYGFLFRAGIYNSLGKKNLAQKDLKHILEQEPNLEKAQELLQQLENIE